MKGYKPGLQKPSFLQADKKPRSRFSNLEQSSIDPQHLQQLERCLQRLLEHLLQCLFDPPQKAKQCFGICYGKKTQNTIGKIKALYIYLAYENSRKVQGFFFVPAACFYLLSPIVQKANGAHASVQT